MGMGFKEVAWVDVTAFTVAGVNERLAAAQATSGARTSLGPHVLFGPDFVQMLQNQKRNAEEGRTVVIQGVFDRP